MAETINVTSYAKINLHLDVGSKRADNFHDIYSIFQAVAFGDEIEISIGKKLSGKKPLQELIKLKGNFSCPNESNLIYKATSLFMEKSEIYFYVNYDVSKVIPEGGGLGGGSSNAASVLLCLNSYFDNIINQNELLQIASALGSDIPFFLEKRATALVSGKGEIITPLDINLPEYKLILVYPDFPVKTADAYSWLDEDMGNTYHYPAKPDIASLSKYPEEWKFFNSFTKSLEKRFNVYSKIFSVFNHNNAQFYNITGSGSTAFGIFTDETNLNKSYSEIKRFCPYVWITNTLAGKVS